MFALAVLLAAQATPVPPIPEATGLPPPGTEKAHVVASVLSVLRSIQTHDAATLLAHVVNPDSLSITAAPDATTGGFMHFSWRSAAYGKDSDFRPEQRLTNPLVELDGNIAMVWSPYVSLRDGKAWHCGYAHFDLIRIQGQWKVQSFTRTQHATGCSGQ